MPAFIRNSEVPIWNYLEHDRCFRIAVIWTDSVETETALRAATELSVGLHATIDVIVAQVVPYPLSLAEPPVPPSFTLGRLGNIPNATKMESRLRVYLCRDVIEALVSILERYSVVVVGSRKRWLWTRPKQLAKTLRRKGFPVILVRCH